MVGLELREVVKVSTPFSLHKVTYANIVVDFLQSEGFIIEYLLPVFRLLNLFELVSQQFLSLRINKVILGL